MPLARIECASVSFSISFSEALLISLAVLLNLVYTTSGILLLALQIAAVYVIVRLLTYKNDKKEAQKINERLKTFKNEV